MSVVIAPAPPMAQSARASQAGSPTVPGKAQVWAANGTTDISPLIQAEFDAGAVTVEVDGPGPYLLNSPLFLDSTVNTPTGKSQDYQNIIDCVGTGVFILGSGLPTCPQFQDPTTKWWVFPNTLRSAFNAGANTVTCNDSTAANGGNEATAPRLVVRNCTFDGGGTAAFSGSQNVGVAMSNECAVRDEFCRLRGSKYFKSFVGYSDGQSSLYLSIHNTRGAENLGATQGVGALSAALSTGAPITSLPITLAQPVQIYQQVTVTDGGSNQQTFTASASALAGASSLPVSSATPNFAYQIGATAASVVIFGCWGLLQQTNGDNVLIDNPQMSGPAGAYWGQEAGGITIRNGIAGAYVFNWCESVKFLGGMRLELSNFASPAPGIMINCSDVTIEDANWFPGGAPGGYAVLVNDSTTTPGAATNLTIRNCKSRFRPSGDSPRPADVYLQNLNNGSLLQVENGLASTVYSGGTFDYSGGALIVQSAMAAVTTALNQTGVYAAFQKAVTAYPRWELRRVGAGGAWGVRTNGPTLIDQMGTPGAVTVAAASYTGGTLASGQPYAYAVACRHDDNRNGVYTAEVQGTPGAPGSLLITTTIPSSPCSVVVWRKTGTGVVSAPDHFAVIPWSNAQVALVDTGTTIGGVPWQTTSIPVPNSAYTYTSSVNCWMGQPGGVTYCWGAGNPTTNGIPGSFGSTFTRSDNGSFYLNLSGGVTWTQVLTVTPVVSHPAPTSGTPLQDATGLNSTWYVPIAAHAGGSVSVSIGPTATPANAIIVADDATLARTHTVEVPANWYVQITVAGSAAIGTVTAVTHN